MPHMVLIALMALMVLIALMAVMVLMAHMAVMAVMAVMVLMALYDKRCKSLFFINGFYSSNRFANYLYLYGYVGYTWANFQNLRKKYQIS